ncbi:nicotinate-nucleotide adenylyltransferase [Candidatus Colwellia aromaticivorans]|uniref:nicotinate-nucleotide adenylyltransferase n=1 Tax=Candidatus Colwellia aromaticivorans TaxID=2267621 RepID=UPI000DF2E5D0|nr:nicotinate-nucleotide adenylyltransferase [Candidatus Colwellia aromaticivorans]
MTSIGILGGTFDPIHLGHTLPAKAVADYLSLTKILLIPANIPPHKATPNVSAKQRAEMVHLACSTEPLLTCDERELKRDGNSYTVDTLKELAESFPQQTLYFIIGLDSLLTFTRWHKYQEILSLCHLVVNTRPNYQLDNLDKATAALLNNHQIHSVNELKKRKSGGVLLLPDTLPSLHNHLHIDISSSEIRQQLANKQDCQQLLAPSVFTFINKNKLYR